jgi:hypothetical protein
MRSAGRPTCKAKLRVESPILMKITFRYLIFYNPGIHQEGFITYP